MTCTTQKLPHTNLQQAINLLDVGGVSEQRNPASHRLHCGEPNLASAHQIPCPEKGGTLLIVGTGQNGNLPFHRKVLAEPTPHAIVTFN
jgi:hypothetical protein